MDQILEDINFSFPFSPYEVQTSFMKSLYKSLDEKKLAIFESPTGTGKSLSIICGALTWFEDYVSSYKDDLQKLVDEKEVEVSGDDWLSSTAKEIEKENEKRKAKLILQRLKTDEEKFKKIRNKRENIRAKYLTKKSEADEAKGYDKEQCTHSDSGDNEFILDDYDSGDSDRESDDGSPDLFDELHDETKNLKIFYCSRTHSQLSQFVRELQKTRFASSVRVSILGSRKTLCINEDVLKLQSLALVNERCLELQKGKKVKGVESPQKKKPKLTSCPYNKLTNVENLSNQIVVMPYNCLLHKETREACNLNLKNSIVIVDEAHNLLETIGNIYSIVLSYEQISVTRSELAEYLARFEKRLLPKNLLYIKQILFLLKSYQKLLNAGKLASSSEQDASKLTKLLSIQDFLFETSTDNLSFRKLISFIEKSKIAFKIRGYKKRNEGEVKVLASPNESSTASFLTNIQSGGKGKMNQVQEKETKVEVETNVSGASSALGLVSALMKSLVCGISDGRILVNSGLGENGTEGHSRKGFIKYLLLNPASQFRDVVKECRSVIVAGGTMSPMEEFRNQLFLGCGAPLDRIQEFSCSHVVDSGNVLPVALTKGPGGIAFDFTYKNRKNSAVVDELGRCLLNMCNVIPGGIVVFFPSYDYENFVLNHFEKNKMIEKISSKKMVFREPRTSAQMERVLRKYSDAALLRGKNENSCNGSKGAILFSVVGGKMSEGINFSDDLGRCVVMVGLPYPNSTSVELKTKMTYLDQNFPRDGRGKTAGEVYYENLCFKAVNQSIGRSIRHRNDYASILLLDQRYALSSSISNLPTWINSGIRVCDQFGKAFVEVKKFFDKKIC